MSINQYLQEQQRLRPEQATWFASMEELYNSKLWHLLSVKLFQYLDQAPGDKNLLELHQRFVSDFETKMDPTLLVQFASKVVQQMNEPDKAIQFIGTLKEKVKHTKMACVHCSIMIAEQKHVKNDTKEVEKLLEELNTEIDHVDGVTPIHARYYLLASDHYKKIGDHCKYYRNSLRYLGCLSDSAFIQQQDSQPMLDHQDRAFTMALAALLGDEIFNFGELLQHPIVNSIHPSKKWVFDLLEAFNAGDLATYESLKSQWSSQADLASNALELRKKITLMCLMEMTFKSHDGILTFDEIARQARVDISDVEMLVMRALSLELVKGSIDQVKGRVHLWWVQPRVLNRAQIMSLRSRLDHLCKDVSAMEQLMEAKGQEIIG